MMSKVLRQHIRYPSPSIIIRSSAPVDAKLKMHNAGHISNIISSLESKHRSLKQQRNELMFLITQLSNQGNESKPTDSLLSDFERRISLISGRLEERFQKICEIEGKFKSFRQADDQLPKIIDAIQKKAGSDLAIERSNLFEEYQNLVSLASAQEKRIELMKLKLSLCHDHRYLYKLKKRLVALRNGDEYYEISPDVAALKTKVARLKGAIIYERRRLDEEEGVADYPGRLEAITIQKTWRGYRYRKAHPKAAAT